MSLHPHFDAERKMRKEKKTKKKNNILGGARAHTKINKNRPVLKPTHSEALMIFQLGFQA